MKQPDFDFDESAFWLEPDFVLADIVTTMVNLMELPIGITLFIKGAVLTGTLVSEREYLAALTEMFTSLAKQSFRPTGSKEVEEIEDAFSFQEMAETELPSAGESEDEVTMLPPVRHLHLRDATVLTPGPSISFAQSGFPMMRIRLNAVDGWMLGQAMAIDDMDMDDDAEINGAPRRLH
ncbi:MAG: hypothetical protein SF029_26775 [bacterium]|nr:hypothetical protein [bacterium]